MTPNRLQQIEAILTAKLFPNGGWDEVCELIEAVKGLRRENGNLRKALFSGENNDGTVDLSVAADVLLRRDPWAIRRQRNIEAVQVKP